MTVGICNTLEEQIYPDSYPAILIKKNTGEQPNDYDNTSDFKKYTSLISLPTASTIINGRYQSTYTLPSTTSSGKYSKTVPISVPYNYSGRDVASCEVKYVSVEWTTWTSLEPYREFIETTVNGSIINGVLTFNYRRPEKGDNSHGVGVIVLEVLY